MTQNSLLLLDYYWRRWGKKTGDITYINNLAVISQIIKRPFPVLVVAPSQQGKSTPLVEDIKPNWDKYVKWLGSDFTIHSLCGMDSDGVLQDKTWIINDMTLLLSSKAERTQQRLINGLAEVLSEGYYEYSDRMTQKMKKIECINVGKNGCNMILCITQRSFQKNEEKLIENTFGNRLLKVFYSLTMVEQEELYLTIQERSELVYPKLKKIYEGIPKITKPIRKMILALAKTIYIHQMSTSLIKQAQILERVVLAQASLDNHKVVTEKDIEIVEKIIMTYVKDNDNAKRKLFDLWLEGTYKYYEISRIIERSISWIEKQVNEFKQSGIITTDLIKERDKKRLAYSGTLESL